MVRWLLVLAALTTMVLSKPLCDPASTYCEDPPNYPVHTIHKLLQAYSNQLRILLPDHASPLSAAESGGVDGGNVVPDSPDGGNAVDGGEFEEVEANEVS